MKNKRSNLEDHYSGDPAWEAFSTLFLDDFHASPVRDALLAIVSDESLAAVIAGSFGADSLSRLDETVPALGDESPKACLQTTTGQRRLKEMLMRMPR